MYRFGTRWALATLLALGMTSIGCARPAKDTEGSEKSRRPIVADDSLVHAFDTDIEMRITDRLELDSFRHDRDIRIEVIEGVINIRGEVWTLAEKERVSNLVRNVAGMIDVINRLDIRPPR